MNPMKFTLNPSHIRKTFVRLLVSGLVALLLGVFLALPALAAGSGTWTTTASMHASRTSATATLLPNGQALVAGGLNFDGIADVSLASAELYNPATGTWTVTGSMNTPILPSPGCMARTMTAEAPSPTVSLLCAPLAGNLALS